MLRRLTWGLTLIIAGWLSCLVAAVAVVMLTWRAQDVAQVATAVAILRADLARTRTATLADHEAVRRELDDFARTLYAPAVDTPNRRATTIEQWMVQRDTELQKRIQALEYWRLRMER